MEFSVAFLPKRQNFTEMKDTNDADGEGERKEEKEKESGREKGKEEFTSFPHSSLFSSHWLSLSLSFLEMASLLSSLSLPPDTWHSLSHTNSNTNSISLTSGKKKRDGGVRVESESMEGERGRREGEGECVALNAPRDSEDISLNRKSSADKTFSDIQGLRRRLTLTCALEILRLSLLSLSSDSLSFSLADGRGREKERWEREEREGVRPSVHLVWMCVQVCLCV